MTDAVVSHQVACPICAGRGTCGDRRGQGHRCALCDGTGAVTDAQVQPLQQLREHMMRVADAMRGGRADDAGAEARIAFRLALRMLSTGGS